jgi:hypothetical protein
MRHAAMLALVLLATPALAQTPLTGSTGEPSTATPPLAGTAVAPGPAAGPAASPEAAPARGERAAHHARLEPRSLAERFHEADTKHDGHLTVAEARVAKMGEVVRDFGLIDKNKTGSVTLEEIQQFRQERRAARAAEEAR